MWLIIPAVSLGEAAMAARASWCKLFGSKTYHRSWNKKKRIGLPFFFFKPKYFQTVYNTLMVSSQLQDAMNNTRSPRRVIHVISQLFGTAGVF